MKTIILAGGQGTRLGLKDIPKPMVPVAGKPLLEHQVELLKRYHLTDIIFLTGYLSEKIEDYFGNGEKWGVNISCIKEKLPLSTAGALKQLEPILKERFLILYGDLMLDLDLQSLIDFDSRDKTTIGTIVVHPNDHPYDSDLVDINQDGYVNQFLSKPHKEGLIYNNNVNAAVYILSPDIFNYIGKDEICDFGKDIFPRIIKQKQHKIRAYNTPEYLKDLGTPDRLKKVEEAYLNGYIARQNKSHKRFAIFLDRDGVINEEVDNLRNIADFKLIPKVIDAIRLINKSEYLAIIVTNQPVIAKGWLTEEDLREIHKQLETELGNERVYVNKIYYCPHHPDVGFEGEIPHLKIECNCRKPQIGMITKAVEEFNIDVNGSFIIGDTTSDIMMGKNAGLKTILVKTGYAGSDRKYDSEPDFTTENLFEAIKLITNN